MQMQSNEPTEETFAFLVDGRVLEVKARNSDRAKDIVNQAYMEKHWSGQPFAWMDGPRANEFIATPGDFTS